MKISELLLESERHVMYHVTPSDNVRSILANGLKPSIGSRSAQLETNSGIYLFPSKQAAEDAVMNWLGDEFDEDTELALLAVDVTGIEGKFTPNAQYEYVVKQAIDPKRIKLLSASI